MQHSEERWREINKSRRRITTKGGKIMYGSLTPTPVLANVLHPSEAVAIILGVKTEKLEDEDVFLYFIKIRKIVTVLTMSKLQNDHGYELKL